MFGAINVYEGGKSIKPVPPAPARESEAQKHKIAVMML